MGYPTLSQGARLTAVKLKDAAGAEAGKVVEWMMDVEQGRVVYVVAEFNKADDYYAIPWSWMKADIQNGGYNIDREKVEEKNVRIPRADLNDIVNDKTFLDNLMKQYGLDYAQVSSEQQGQQDSARTPSASSAGERGRSDQQTYPSNAEVSEGKGYGG